MKSKKINILYISLVCVNIALSLYSMLIYYLWWNGHEEPWFTEQWQRNIRTAVPDLPFLFNLRTVLILSALTLPMFVACILFYKSNKISLQRYRRIKGLIIWSPLMINLYNILGLLYVLAMFGMRDFAR